MAKRGKNGQFLKKSKWKGGKTTRSASGVEVITSKKRSKYGRGGSGVLATARGFASTQVIGATVAAAAAGTAAGWLGYGITNTKLAAKLPWIQSGIGKVIFQLVLGFGLFWGVRKLAPKYAFPAAIGVMLPVVSDLWKVAAAKLGLKGLPESQTYNALPSGNSGQVVGVGVGTPAPIRLAR